MLRESCTALSDDERTELTDARPGDRWRRLERVASGARVPACLLDEDVRFAPALDAITQEAMQ